MRYSETITVTLMKSLRSGLSNPLDESSANHFGLRKDPLQTSAHVIIAEVAHSIPISQLWYAVNGG